LLLKGSQDVDEHEWLTCAAPWRLCSWLSDTGRTDDRKVWLLACACARRVLPLANKKRARLAVEAAELYAR
jgi:hypothetical protein